MFSWKKQLFFWRLGEEEKSVVHTFLERKMTWSCFFTNMFMTDLLANTLGAFTGGRILNWDGFSMTDWICSVWWCETDRKSMDLSGMTPWKKLRKPCCYRKEDALYKCCFFFFSKVKECVEYCLWKQGRTSKLCESSFQVCWGIRVADELHLETQPLWLFQYGSRRQSYPLPKQYQQSPSSSRCDS